MADGSIMYIPLGRDRCACVLTTSRGDQLRIEGEPGEENPTAEGDKKLVTNRALLRNAWAFAENEFQYRRLRNKEKRQSHRKEADQTKKSALWIASLTTHPVGKEVVAWCSACLHKTTHRRAKRVPGPPTLLCLRCGSPTTPCFAPLCDNMANRGTGFKVLSRYCAEHRHEVPGFAKAGSRLATIDEYRAWLEFDKANLMKATRILTMGVGGAAIVAPAAFLAAPVIGGVIGGSFIGGGLSGAAAVSHGLALLGGGSLAAGGFGMAGGTAVIAVAGAALGTALGGELAAAYVSTDSSFAIEKLRDGSGPPVLLASGFLTQGDKGWGTWRSLVDERYPKSPVYRVFWGSKELKSFGILSADLAGKAAAAHAVKEFAQRGMRGAKIPGLNSLLLAQGVARNPWSVAKSRADMTGAILAVLLARTDTPEFVLAGHSLGARVMTRTAQLLGSDASLKRPKLKEAHLLACAMRAGGDWRTLDRSVSHTIWNYRSRNDWVLKNLYQYAQLGHPAVGVKGFGSAHAHIKDRDVSRSVHSHSDYFETVRLKRE